MKMMKMKRVGGWSIILVIYSICGGWAPILNSNTRAAKWKCLPLKITFPKPNLPQCQNFEGSLNMSISWSISSTNRFPEKYRPYWQCWWQFTLPWAIRAPIEGGTRQWQNDGGYWTIGHLTFKHIRNVRDNKFKNWFLSCPSQEKVRWLQVCSEK